MRFTISSAVAFLAATATAVSALEKPLDIQVTKAVECDRKTKTGECAFNTVVLVKTSCLVSLL